MNSSSQTEHFVTLFDSHYLPQGLCLYRSLEEHGRPFHLWIVAMDGVCAAALEELRLGDATVIRLQEVESDALRSVKPGRTIGEYCWTLTPFLPSHVFSRAPYLDRVTYVDADVFFFDSPAPLVEEFTASGKHVLITEHAFAPEYAGLARFGRFCVQFVTFRNTHRARRVLQWWQDRCIEWCFAREERGQFGDQKYLDQWPALFPAEVHVLTQTDRTLAPWNVAYASLTSSPVRPVIYHFHGLKVVSPRKVVLYHRYRVGRGNRWIYDRYLRALRAAVAQLRGLGVPVIGRPAMDGPLSALRLAWQVMTGRAAHAQL